LVLGGDESVLEAILILQSKGKKVVAVSGTEGIVDEGRLPEEVKIFPFVPDAVDAIFD